MFHCTNCTQTYLDPLDALSHVLLLLLFQNQLNEQLLQLLIAVVYTQLLKTSERQFTNKLLM